MRRLSSTKAIYIFTRKNKPAYAVSDGERVIVETKDAFSGLARSPKVLFERLDMGKVNPATGPIEIEGLAAGEVLSVSIERIELGRVGVMMCSPELGNLAKDVRRSRTKIIEISGKRARFSEDLSIDLNPHVGVIGVSPAEGEYPTFYPRDFGGNLDTAEAGEGSRVYLPSFVDGGMVSLGDVHAAMGDGEVCGTGIEVPAEIIARFSKAPELDIKRPMLETADAWISYAAAKTLDEAATLATSDMVKFISERAGLDFEDAYMLASAAADLRISQVADPLMAAKMRFPKKYL